MSVAAVAVLTVAIAFGVAIRGLAGDPVRSTDGAGISTLQGTFFPYECGPGSCRGYIQAGGRSVFVVFPGKCAEPARASDITVQARRAPDLGKGSYTALGCAAKA